MSKTALITGCNGFIGANIGNRLMNMGYDIHGVDNVLRNHDALPVEYISRRDSESFYKELSEGKEILPKPDVIIHMGACSSTTEGSITTMMNNNLVASMLLAQYADEHNIRFIYASSAAVYGEGKNFMEYGAGLRPLNLYGNSKLMFDNWMIRNDMDGVGLRFFNVYGPGEEHKNGMASMITRGYQQIQEFGGIRLFMPGIPFMARDFVYVQDVVSVVVHFIQNPFFDGIFNVGTGHARTWPDIALAWATVLKQPVTIHPIGFPHSLGGKYQYYTCANLDRLRDVADYRKPFRTLENGIQDYYKCYIGDKDGDQAQSCDSE